MKQFSCKMSNASNDLHCVEIDSRVPQMKVISKAAKCRDGRKSDNGRRPNYSAELPLHKFANFPVGNVLNTPLMQYAPAAYLETLKTHFNLYTAEYEHKPPTIEAALDPNNPNHELAMAQLIRIADFTSGKKVLDWGDLLFKFGLDPRIGGEYTGTVPGCNNYPPRYLDGKGKPTDVNLHTIIWANTFQGDSNIPNWVKNWDPSLGQAAFLTELENYVVEYVQFLLDLGTPITSIDVMNEGIDSISGQFSVIAPGVPSQYVQYGGPTFFINAYRALREAFPKIKLVYNSWQNLQPTWHTFFGPNYLVSSEYDIIIKPLADLGLLDGVGIQMHLDAFTDFTLIEELFVQYSADNLSVSITEMDYDPGQAYNLDYSPDSLSQEQSNIFWTVLDLYQTHVPKRLQSGVTFWGVEDTTSWIGETFYGKLRGEKPLAVFPLLWTDQPLSKLPPDVEPDCMTKPVSFYVPKRTLYTVAKNFQKYSHNGIDCEISGVKIADVPEADSLA